MTGTACGHPDCPTVARRPMRCERRNSSSGSVKTITPNPIVAAAAVPLVDCKDSVWTRAILRRQKTRRRHGECGMASIGTRGLEAVGGYSVVPREPLERLAGSVIQPGHERTCAPHIHIPCTEDHKPFSPALPTIPQD